MSNIITVKKRLKKLLQENLERLTKELATILSTESHCYDDFVIINGRLKQLVRDDSRNILSAAEKEKAYSSVRVALLQIINSATSEDLDIDLLNQSNGDASEGRFLIKQNREFISLERRYRELKDWIEQNFKEFDHVFIEKEVKLVSEDEQYILEDSKQSNSRAEIFGSFLRLSSQIEKKSRWRLFDREENFASKKLENCQYILDVTDLESIEYEEEVKMSGYNTELRKIKLSCIDGLSKIKVDIFNEFDRIQYDEKIDEWDPNPEEKNIDDYHTGQLVLRCTNQKFMGAFIEKVLYFKSVCEDLKL